MSYRPPAPTPLTDADNFGAVLFARERDILQLLPARAFDEPLVKLALARRPIWLVSEPAAVRQVLVERVARYAKSDLMVGALEPLLGDGIFISDGATWRRQRAMIEPAFAQLGIKAAFGQMSAAHDRFEARLDATAGAPVALDEELSTLAADIIFRTIFSRPIEDAAARAVYHAFARYQASVSQIDTEHLLLSRPWQKIPQPPEALQTCQLIRDQLGALVDARLDADTKPDGPDDIAAALIAARDAGGVGFTRRELIDQIALFFIAGHETTASALCWSLFILSQQPATADRLRAEVDALATLDDEPLAFEQLRALDYTRAVFRETLRLYPPVSFITRTALDDDLLAGERIERGALVVVAPWIIQRHRALWREPDVFDATRFLPSGEARDDERIPAGAYLPFGFGPRVCIGASFATTEATLILARLLRRYRLEALDPEQVEPICRLTTRPRDGVQMRFIPR